MLGANAEGGLDLAPLDALLTPEVKVFAFTHVSNTLGTINPVAELCRRARAVGIVTVIDGAQSIGHMPVDVRAIGCDFLAFSGHKMAGPTGIGVLYGRQALLETMPPYQGGGGMMVNVDLFENATWKPAPERFEAGTPNFADAVALGVACDYLDALGRDQIAAHDGDLARVAYEKLSALPRHPPARPDRRARRPGELRLPRRARARHRDVRRRGRHRAARRPPLQPAADAQTRPHEHHARQLLRLQHPRGDRRPRRLDARTLKFFAGDTSIWSNRRRCSAPSSTS